ncbi:MAG: YciI family protein [Myxococcales bacterium]|nr:YciI family protein [Myxococcales bacterium]MCB9575710.1 YciI family protein [Polyangiaceae bacterium]
MKYMILTYLDENAWLALSPEEQERQMNACAPHIEQLLKQKKLLAGAPLHPTTTATTIKNRDGKRLVLDGPFAETREQLGGYTIIEADDLDDAIAIAAGFIGESTLPTLELRPIVDFDGTPVAP